MKSMEEFKMSKLTADKSLTAIQQLLINTSKDWDYIRRQQELEFFISKISDDVLKEYFEDELRAEIANIDDTNDRNNKERYFIVHNPDSKSEYGWIYTSTQSDDESGDTYNLTNPLTEFGPELHIQLPKTDVLEISREEYQSIYRHSIDGQDPSGLIKMVIETHLN